MRFWDFSLECHGRPGVGEACIALQDAHGADVNMLLFALWTGGRGSVLDAASMARLDARVTPWRTGVIRPLRAARRALKPAPDGVDPARAQALRQQLLASELEAEHVQQDMMEAAAPPPNGGEAAACVRANLAYYATMAGIPADAPGLAALAAA